MVRRLRLSTLTRSGIILFLALVVMLSAVSPKVRGQASNNGFNLTTTPTVALLDTKPGVATSTKIQIKNNNQATEHIKVSLLRFTSNNKNGSPELVEPDQNDEFTKWISFSEPTFDAESNVWKTIQVTINPPASAAFGYYYAVVFSRQSVTTENKVTNLKASIAVPILLDVNAPGEVRKSNITSFKSDKSSYEFLPAKFTVTMNNEGNTHVAPRGNIFITKGGKSVALLEVNQGKGNILPKSQRDYFADWNDGSPAYKLQEVDGKVVLKNGKPSSKLDWAHFDPSKLRFGKYHAKVAMVYSDGLGDVSSTGDLDFWVIPWRIIGVSTLFLLVIAAGLWALVIRPLRKGLMKLPIKRKPKL